MELNRPNHHTLYTHTASTRLPGDPRFLDPTPLKVSMPYKTGCLPGERPMYLASNSPFLDARYSKRENEQKNSLFSKYVTSRNNVIRVVSYHWSAHLDQKAFMTSMLLRLQLNVLEKKKTLWY